jgi:hypothetical protein
LLTGCGGAVVVDFFLGFFLAPLLDTGVRALEELLVLLTLAMGPAL